MFNKDNVFVIEKVKDWEESIKIAARPLIEQKNIEKRYVDSMIESINELGFYVVLAENIAMPHARPENGVLKTGVSFLKINEAVKYGDSDINLIFVLAAKDNNTHIDILQKLLEIFQDEDKIKKLIQEKDKNKLLNILEEK